MRELVLQLNPWGAALIAEAQAHAHPALDLFWRVITHLGDGYYVAVALVLFWCLNKRTAARLVAVYAGSLVLNALIKEWVASPRPFLAFPEVAAKVTASGYSFPSGHAQNAAAFGFYGALRARKRWVTVLVAVAAPLIASSRIYLGVHYPHDALAGLVLGLLWASAFVWLDRATETQRRRFAAPALLGLVVVVSAALALTLSASYAHLAAAAWLGAGLGYAAERFWVGLGPAPCHRTGWRRLAVGLVLLACLGGLAAVPGAVTAIKEQRLLGSIAAFVLCLVPTVLAPWLFASLGLVETVSRDGLVRRR